MLCLLSFLLCTLPAIVAGDSGRVRLFALAPFGCSLAVVQVRPHLPRLDTVAVAAAAPPPAGEPPSLLSFDVTLGLSFRECGIPTVPTLRVAAFADKAVTVDVTSVQNHSAPLTGHFIVGFESTSVQINQSSYVLPRCLPALRC